MTLEIILKKVWRVMLVGVLALSMSGGLYAGKDSVVQAKDTEEKLDEATVETLEATQEGETAQDIRAETGISDDEDMESESPGADRPANKK